MTSPQDIAQLNQMTGEFFASEAFRCYSSRLLQLAHDRLGRDIQGKISPEDVVQSAFKSFFRRLQRFNFVAGSNDSIWSLLSIITIRKCQKWNTFYRCEKRSIKREQKQAERSELVSSQPISKEPGPEDALVVAELLEWLFKEFAPRQQQMLLLRIDGCSVDEIALQCQSSRRTVARTIATAKQFLVEYLFDGDSL